MYMEAGKTVCNEAHTREKIGYVHQMLGELRIVAESERADLLSYLIEMAFVEAGDVLSGRSALSISHRKGNKPPGMTV